MHVQAAWHGPSGPAEKRMHVPNGAACEALSGARKAATAQFPLGQSDFAT